MTAVVLLGLASFVSSDKQARSANSQADGSRESVASYYYHPEVRLRKLHLVRPDLIPYPIAYDVYC